MRTTIKNGIKHVLLSCFFILQCLVMPTVYAAEMLIAEDTEGLLFTLHGSNTIGANLAPNLVEAFFSRQGLTSIRRAPTAENEYRISAVHPHSLREVHVDIAAHGSSTGFNSLITRTTDIAMASRPIKDTEVAALASQGNFKSPRAEQVIAIDGLAIIINHRNPINQLAIEDIRRIFTGEIQNWNALGGPNQAINVYARDDRSGTWDTFKHLVLNATDQLRSNSQRFESNDELSSRVASDAFGIGFVGLASVHDTKALLVSDKGTQPLPPTRITVATEDYPLSRRLFMYTSDRQQNAIVLAFLEFVQSEAGQNLVASTGFVSQVPVSFRTTDERDGPSEYLALTRGGQRLSVNIRFAENTAQLDSKAQQDILRIVRFMQQPANRGRNILLIGFGDEKSTGARAAILSKLRAMQVKSALYNHDVLALPVAGFGAYLPVAANHGESRKKNQRVEVWLKGAKPDTLAKR